MSREQRKLEGNITATAGAPAFISVRFVFFVKCNCDYGAFIPINWQIKRATIFHNAVHSKEKATFYERYVAFYEDYLKLDRLLPKDAVLLVQDFRIDAVYAPRPVFFDYADLPPGRPAVLFGEPEGILTAGSSLGHYKIGDHCRRHSDCQYDKLARNFLAGVQLAAAMILLN